MSNLLPTTTLTCAMVFGPGLPSRGSAASRGCGLAPALPSPSSWGEGIGGDNTWNHDGWWFVR